MIQHNDISAPKSQYDKVLLQRKMPRQFWPYWVSQVSFADLTINRSIEGQKKSKVLYKATAIEQAGLWKNFIQMLWAWDPKTGGPDHHVAIFCSENVRDSQFMLFTCMHAMIAKMFRDNNWAYRVETVRLYELWNLLQNTDPMDVPNVVMIPSIVSDITGTQNSTLLEFFNSSYRVFGATALSPQKFFDRFGYLPDYIFYLDTIEQLSPIKSLFV